MRATKDWRTIAIVLACLAPFIGFWATGLTDLDEGFYGAVVASMLRTGDWITPVFNGAPWFEKPILAYWLAAPSVAAFGEDFGPRLPSVLCTLATAFVLFRFFTRHRNRDIALVVAAAYCGSLLVVAIGRMLLTDAPFVLAMVVCLTTFYDSVTGDPKKRTWAGLALGFAFLAKGPVAGLFFLLIAAVFYWRTPSIRPGYRRNWTLGVVLFLAVVASWYVPCYLANREVFVEQFLIEQNIGRFQGGDLAHRTPAWMIPVYFPVVLFLALMPWSVWVPKKDWLRGSDDLLERFLWIWGLTILAFFSISLTKLPHYILPAVAPLLAVTVLKAIKGRQEVSTGLWLKLALGWSIVVASVATTIFMLDYEKRFSEVHRIARYLRGQEGSAVLLNVGRQERDTEMKLTLNKSAHPSFLFYMRDRGRLSDSAKSVTRSESTVWIVVERGEMTSDLSYEIVFGGFTLENVQPPFALKEYEVWKAEPLEPLQSD